MSKIKHLIAACAAITMAGAASAAVVPGGDLGSLSATPSQFFSLSTPVASGSFEDSYTFSVGGNSDIIGSLGAYTQGLSFTQVWLDGVSVVPTAVKTDYGFSFAGIGEGTHTLKIAGTVTGGFLNGYGGSVYATPAAVPEPESLALVLGGLGIVGMVARRRQAI